MIVTFHLFMYFVYNLWNNYVYPQIENIHPNDENSRNANRNEFSSNNQPDISRPLPENEPPSDVNRGSNDNDNNTETSKSSGDKPMESESDASYKIKNLKEGGGDYHPCLQQVISEDEFYDMGSKMIYSCKPQFHCNFDPIDNKMTFIPPVYAQRYMTVEAILKEPCWAESVKKVVDFGCSELNFEKSYLKKLYNIEEIVAVDVDLEVLESNCAKMRPSPTDFLAPRPTPLKVQVFLGSVAYTNDALKGTDAVIAIELIEHLYPGDLDCLPFTIFGFTKPKLAIFTTPNSDFNPLFPGFSGFRHDDHKFEWSRKQFQDWGNNLVQRYPDYQVMFEGIGPGPEHTVEEFGCCTQMATFVKVRESQSVSDHDIHVQDGPYTLILESTFPKEERSQEQIAQDDAEGFLVRCKLLSRKYDKQFVKEVPLTDVMQRIKYYNKERLKELLIERKFRIEKTPNDNDIVVFSEDESEEDYSSDLDRAEDEHENHQSDDDNIDDLLNNDEKWDVVEENTKIDQKIEDDVFPDVQTLNDSKGSAKMRGIIISKLPVSDSIEESCNSSEVGRVVEQEQNPNLESSFYETPNKLVYSDNLKSNCDLTKCSVNSSKSQSSEGCDQTPMPLDVTSEEDKETETSQSTVLSPCDTSVYATPCCSQRHTRNIPKCLSLQYINGHCSSPTFDSTLGSNCKDTGVLYEHKDNLSNCVEGFKSLESCDLTYNSSTSRVVDSGYPDSYSDCNMDMDLTPEQFDEIETESEGNEASSRSPSPPPQAPQFQRVGDDVENGDVANNNRDGEGNNLVADMDEEPMEFEARIEEMNNILPNLAAADQCEGVCKDDCQSCDPSVADETHAIHKCFPSDSLKLKSVFTESQTECYNMIPVDSLEQQNVRSRKSDSSILTNYSWNLDTPENQSCCSEEGLNRSHINEIRDKIKTQNSLTTVLDGCSKFSNCSLVRPAGKYGHVEEKQVCNDALPQDNTDLHTLCTQSDPEENIVNSSKLVHDDRLSVLSVYQSAESIYTPSLDVENITNNSFPKWLLNILVSESEENDIESVDSVSSVWDSDSLEELVSQNHDIQVDTRGGGDPQRDLWN